MITPIFAPDLAKQAPHSPRERIGGFAVASRTADKCLASLGGTLGEYEYNCPLDNLLFNFKGITAEQFKTAVKGASTFGDIGTWLHANGTSRTPAEIKIWSDEMEAASLINNPKRRDHFIQDCHRLGLNPQATSTFDWLEADDRRRFNGKSP